MKEDKVPMIILRKLKELKVKYEYDEESRTVRFATSPEKVERILESEEFRALEYLTLEPKLLLDVVPKDFKRVKVEGEERWYKVTRDGVLVALKTKKGYEVKATTKSFMINYVIRDLYPSLFYYTIPFERELYERAVKALKEVRPSHGSS